jgi:phage terminase Nu1 subunit (DNA packaging protein)
MQFEISTAEAAELFDVTRKTIAEWAKSGVMVKLAHGKYDLKQSLKNWAAYQRCVFEGFDNPMDTWMIRRDIAWSEEHRPRDVDVRNLIPLDDLEPFEIELDARGRIVRGRAIT